MANVDEVIEVELDRDSVVCNFCDLSVVFGSELEKQVHDKEFHPFVLQKSADDDEDDHDEGEGEAAGGFLRVEHSGKKYPCNICERKFRTVQIRECHEKCHRQPFFKLCTKPNCKSKLLTRADYLTHKC